MALIPLIDTGPVTVEQFNAVADSADSDFEALFAGRSPLLWLPLRGSPSWYESRMGGVLYVFGTQANRRILAAEPTHPQSAIDAAVVAAKTLAVNGTAYEHALKQVTIEDIPQPGGVARSLSAHQKTVFLPPEQGGEQMYWCRTLAVMPSGGAPVYHHEHRHTLAVADVVFEGYVPRTFTWKKEWTKFSCIRFHNLDPDPVPLVVTFERADTEIPSTLEVPRWRAAAIRRRVDGVSWQRDGFLLFRARPSDVERLGSTAPWADRIGANGIGVGPEETVLYADGANNVASFASLWCWLEYFSRGIRPEVDFPQSGTFGASDPRTGIWFNPLKVTNPVPRIPPLGDPDDSNTPLLTLSTHGGTFKLAGWHGEPPNQTLVVETFTLTFAELLAGHEDSGLLLYENQDTGQLFLRRIESAEWWNADFIPITTNLVGGIPVAVPHEEIGVEIGTRGTPRLIDMRRASAVPVTESVYGINVPDQKTLVHQVLQVEMTYPMENVPTPLAWTVGSVRSWRFADGTRNNPHSVFDAATYAWDGRVFTAAVELSVRPVGGAFFSDDLTTVLNRENALAETSRPVHWRQRDDALTWPKLGGVWMDPSVPRLSWPLTSDAIFWHPHVVNPIGTVGGDDWYTLPMDMAPVSDAGIARLDGVPPATQTELSTPPLPAPDSLEEIVSHVELPGWWAANRSNALLGVPLGAEIRPVVGVPLMHFHYNALAARLNAVAEVVPFSYLDAQWYGIPFRPPLGAKGIYGGHTYPAGHLASAPAGSQALQRAQALGIPIQHFASKYPTWSGLRTSRVMGTSGVSADSPVYEAFPSLNLLNDLICWFWPGKTLAYGEVTGFVHDASELPPGWFMGNPAQPLSGGLSWAGVTNPEAVVPAFDWVAIADVRAKAVDLDLPFHVERLAIGYQVRVFIPTLNRLGVRRPRSLVPGLEGTAGTRTQAMLVVAPGSDIEFEAVAGRWQFDGDPFRWAEQGQVRLAKWPPYPNADDVYGTTDPLVMETVMALDQAYRRPGVWNDPDFSEPALEPFVLLTAGNPTSGGQKGQWFHGLSLHNGEAPRVRKTVIRDNEFVPAGWSKAPSVVWSVPCPAIQWGTTDLLANPAPAGGFRTLAADTLPDIIEAADLVPAGWNGRGAVQISLHSAGVRPPVV